MAKRGGVEGCGVVEGGSDHPMVTAGRKGPLVP